MKKVSIAHLKIINALIEHKTGIEAAAALNISPANVSYSINKLRKITGKKLFTRTKHGQVPDAYALKLREQYLEISALGQKRNDCIISTYSPLEFVIALNLQHPNENESLLHFINMPVSSEERLTKIKHRNVDYDIGSQLPVDLSVVCQPYIRSNACILTSKHHSIIKNTLTVEHWFDNHHCIWLRDDGQTEQIVNEDALLKDYFSARKVASESTNLLSMAVKCAYSDNIMVCPEAFSATLLSLLPLASYPLPFQASIRFEYFIHYHQESAKKAMTKELLELF